MPNQIKAFLTVDNAAKQKVFKEWRGKPLAAIEERRAVLIKDMGRAYDQAGEELDISKVDCVSGSLAEKTEALVAMHTELAALTDASKERQALEDHSEAIRDNAGYQYPGDEIDDRVQTAVTAAMAKSPSHSLFDYIVADFRKQNIQVGTEEFARLVNGQPQVNRLEVTDDGIMAATFLTTAGWPPESLRDPGYTPSRRTPLQFIDLLPISSTTQEVVKYMEETTYTNAAANVAEAGEIPESTLVLTEREVTVRKVGAQIPVTREELEDEPQVESYLTETLPFMVRQATDKLALIGTGTAPQPTGLNVVTGVQTYAWTIDSNRVRTKPLNVIRRAMNKVRFEGRAMATDITLDPDIFLDIVLSETTAGGYYYGSPQNDFVERIWGLPVAQSDHFSDAKAATTIGGIVGDFRPIWIQLRMRRELDVEWGYIDKDFIKDVMRLKATTRWALVVKRPQAFVKLVMPA